MFGRGIKRLEVNCKEGSPSHVICARSHLYLHMVDVSYEEMLGCAARRDVTRQIKTWIDKHKFEDAAARAGL